MKLQQQDVLRILKGQKRELVDKYNITRLDIIRYRKQMNEFLKHRIEKETIYV
jgi:hypothetical protein